MRPLQRLVLALVVVAGLGSSPAAQSPVLGTKPISASGACVEGGGSPTCAIFSVDGIAVVIVDVRGTFTGTITFETTSQGSTWDTARAFTRATGAVVTTATAPGQFVLMNPGALSIRARGTAWTSGTATIVATRGYVTDTIQSTIVGCDTCTPSETTTSKSAAYSSTQTGTAFWTPASTRKVVVAWGEFQCGGTTAGTVTLWLGASGDTTYTEGTDQRVAYFDCATPSATVRPALTFAFQLPVVANTADHVLRVTTSAAITVDVVVHGYEK
jgi:hypothetical protein